MLTLSYGFFKPQANDDALVVFPALEDNIQQLNDHSHNGVDSAQLTSASIVSVRQTISSASWALVSGGHYKQTVTLPAGFDYDTVGLEFRISTTGHLVYPTVEKVASTQFDVYFDDPSLSLVVLYN
jgi:hypothetical protein